MKITQEMRDNNGVPAELEKAKQAVGVDGIKDTTTTDISGSERPAGSSQIPANSDDISPEGLLNVIK